MGAAEGTPTSFGTINFCVEKKTGFKVPKMEKNYIEKLWKYALGKKNVLREGVSYQAVKGLILKFTLWNPRPDLKITKFWIPGSTIDPRTLQ